jgi:hypothetical protein
MLELTEGDAVEIGKYSEFVGEYNTPEKIFMFPFRGISFPYLFVHKEKYLNSTKGFLHKIGRDKKSSL